MDERHWDSNNDVEELFDEEPQDYTTYIRVNGSVMPLEAGADFIDTIKTVAQQSKLGKFRLYMNGAEIFPEDGNLPDRIEEGMQFEMSPYDKAGV